MYSWDSKSTIFDWVMNYFLFTQTGRRSWWRIRWQERNNKKAERYPQKTKEKWVCHKDTSAKSCSNTLTKSKSGISFCVVLSVILFMTFKYLGASAAVELDSLSYISDIDIEQVQTLQHCNEYPGSRLLQLPWHRYKTRKLFSYEETPIIDINVK